MISVCLAAQTGAATFSVSVDDTGFSPATLSINVGDTVIWVNIDENFTHTATSDLQVSDPDYWLTELFFTGASGTNTFSNPGTFTYRDDVDPNNTGTIIVTGPQAIVLQVPRIVGSQFLFDVSGLTPGQTNVVQSSTNLVQWSAVSTNIGSASSMTITNTVSPGQKLFRVVELE
jgi:plastocyanin